VFCVFKDVKNISLAEVVLVFKEQEGTTIIGELADQLKKSYSFIASWITLTVHSFLKAVGLTAAFSNALAQNGIGYNVVASFYHDYIFVDGTDVNKATEILKQFSN